MNIKFLIASISGIGALGGFAVGGYYFFKKEKNISEKEKETPTALDSVSSQRNTSPTTTPASQVAAK